ncbi:heme o synthase [Fodinisporobacter ferrooxydans]|uniref:Protoheme IX farnesyltransferase n=1 Tax=Fodinisporobacter ferrooxydans TaxID=2901836 RepID=A0ABY4CKI1_9BACL|nr:heme o synthase [Alicyclobacillaceae bacterium MYW30-H2]
MEHPVSVQTLNETRAETAAMAAVETTVSKKFGGWQEYIGVTKVGITGANLFTTFVGLWLASRGHLQVDTLSYTCLGSALVIAGACALNNYIDRDIDRRMERTRKRALVQGRLEAKAVLWLGIVLVLSGLLALATLTTIMASIWGLIGVFTYVCIYTMWLKRSSPLSTAIGGIAGAAPPVIGWTAVTGQVSWTAMAVFAFLFLWQPPHFYALAMKRTEEYRNAGIPLVPVVHGFEITKRKILQWTIVMVPETLLFYFLHVAGSVYGITAVVLGFLYIVYARIGLTGTDDVAWAKRMFRYSLIYMNALFLVMIFDLV